MRLYADSGENLIRDIKFNKLSDMLVNEFIKYYGHTPNKSEVNSWTNSFQFIKNELESTKLFDIWVVVEYELPYIAKRIDVMFLGKGKNGKNIVIMELKQWSDVKPSNIDRDISTFTGGAERDIPHPSDQVAGYYYNLNDFMDVFTDDKIKLYACAYCHNYSRKENDPLFQPLFDETLSEFPLFTKNDFNELGSYLTEKLEGGDGQEVYNDFIHSNIKPSKKLIAYISDILRNQKVFSLIDEQILANNTIIDRAKKAAKLKRKSVIIVEGGPGTGKSVIALNAMAELLSKDYKVFHATGSKAFTSSLQKIVGSGERKSAKNFFLYFNNFANRPTDDIDVLIADEAHRIPGKLFRNNKIEEYADQQILV